jgi:hypothetical protein
MKSIDRNTNQANIEKVTPDSRTSGHWFKNIVMHASKLADNELELLKSESVEKIKFVQKKTNLIILAYLFLFSGMIALGASVTYALSPELPPWITLVSLAAISILTGVGILKFQSS